MQASMYTLSVPVFKRMLGNLSAILEKAAAHAQQRGVDPAVLLASRLFPDMFPLTRQVQLACDFAKGAASRLAGQQPPKYEDNEASFQQLRARIERTIAFVDSIRPEQIDGSEQRQIELQLGGTTRSFDGLTYLAHVALPNFYFHVATAYAILRHNGIELGKRDFVGPG